MEPGPFTDRVRISGLRLREGRRRAVAGRLVDVVDVSELIVLELRADFYDRRGRLVGSGVQVFDTEAAEPFEDTALPSAVRADEPAPRAVAAELAVPQLVNG